jgi:alcohol dehydrogenase class IV
VTDFAILTHNGVKHPLVDEKLLPKAAILDGDLLTALPRSLIADGGFDAISHALEALVATNAGAITDALATDSFCGVYHNLGQSFGGNTGVRQTIHNASCMAGLAFSQAGLGLCHAASHALGGMFHIPHGRLNAILLPAVISLNASVAGAKYAALSRNAGFGGAVEAMGVRNLKNALIRLRRELKLPGTLSDAGVSPQKLRESQRALVDTILEDPCCKTNPVKVDKALVARLLNEVAGSG